MATRKVKKARKKKPDDADVAGLMCRPDYEEYAREQEKRLRELEDELSGDSMRNPPDKDYT